MAHKTGCRDRLSARRVAFARGYGVREVGRSERVDAHTLFAIGSNTKAFTAATVGLLVDEGKLRWDDPVIQHLPGFQLFDPYVTRELTLRDLLTHRSGLARGDMLWYADLDARAQVADMQLEGLGEFKRVREPRDP